MNAIFFMLPIMLLIGLSLLALFIWALKSGQFEDLEAQKYRIFFDDK
ncbi:MAG: hypothetical protein KatS3mg068_0154 [Candidatus Sericytochromatia bacterium]|nr:MAG: hypothetical protein KatS3mg068_0154 [Candidatus Sericytochromatia bacterium]